MTLIVWFCLTALDTQCAIVPVASGFVTERQCRAYSPLMLTGWKALNPDKRMDHWSCTARPEYIINGGKA